MPQNENFFTSIYAAKWISNNQISIISYKKSHRRNEIPNIIEFNTQRTKNKALKEIRKKYSS